MDWANEVLKNPVKKESAAMPEAPASTKKIDWAAEVLDPTKRKFLDSTPLNSVLTEEMMGEQQQPADFSTMAQGGFADDPKTKIGVYATRRFPSMKPEDAIKRYGIHNGEIVYMDDDGKVKYEVPPKIGPRLKRFAAEEGFARAPSMILGAGGSVVGPVTAAGGAAAGELIRKGIGKMVYGDPGTAQEAGVSALKEGGAALVSDLAANKAIGLIDWSRGRLGKRLIKTAGRDIERMSIPEIQRMQSLGRRHGINLSAPELTRSPKLVDKFKLLADLPETAEKAGAARVKRYEEVSDAVERYLDTFAPPTTSPGEAGRRAVEASKGAIKTENDVRAGMAKPLYDEAFGMNAAVDTSEAIGTIDELLSKTVKGDPSFAALKRIRNMIEEAEGNLEKLDRVKRRGIDLVLNKSKVDPTIRREMAITKDSLRDSMKRATLRPDGSSAYGDALEMFSDYSIIPEALKGTKIATLSKLEGDAQEKAAYLLFHPKQSSPEIVSIAKHFIVNEGGEDTWNALLRVYINDAFDVASKTPRSGFGAPNAGSALSQALYGAKKQRKIFEAALDTRQKAYFRNFAEVLERTGLIFGKESATSTRQVALGRARAEGSLIEKGLEYADSVDLTKPFSWLGAKVWNSRIREVLFAKRNEAVLNAMLDQRGADQLQRMLKMTPRSRNLIRAFGVFTGQLAEGARSGGKEREATPDMPIPYMQQIDELPQAVGMNGAVYQDTESGMIYESDGKNWKLKSKPKLKMMKPGK